MEIRIISMIVWCLWIGCKAWASIPPYIFRHLDIVDGMSDNQIRGLSMLPDHRLAVRTASILNLYNGAGFEHFYYEKNKEYKWDYWGGTKEYCDNKNRLWMKERDYLLLLDLNTHQFNYDIEGELAQLGIHTKIKNLFLDEDKNIWTVTVDSTFSYYDIKTRQPVFVSKGEDSFIRQYGIPKEIAQYKGQCWIIYSSGLIRCWDYYSKEFVSQDTRFLGKINEKTDRISIQPTASGNLWLMYNHGISYYDRLNQQWADVATISGRSNFFTCMDLDKEGNVWVGTSLSGLRFIDAQTFHITTLPFMKLDSGGELVNDIYTILVDDNNGLWVGTLFQGLCYYQPSMRKFRLAQTKQGDNYLSNENVRCFWEESDGSILVGSACGLFRFLPDQQKLEQIHPQLANELCMSVCRDSKGRLWVTTFLSGIYCIDGHRLRNYKWMKTDEDQEPVYNTARCLYEDKNGRYWVSITGGIAEFFPETGEIQMLYEKHPKVSAFKLNYEIFPQDDDTFGAIGESGIFYYNTRTDSVYIPEIDDPQNPEYKGRNTRYYAFFTDSRSLEWQATDIGINVWDGEHRKLYQITAEQGLPSNTVSAILEDANGCVWVSTASGICKIEVKKEGNMYNWSFVNFGEFDGLQSGKFYSQAVLHASDGTMYFGGVHGFNYFHPQQIVYNQSVNTPMFTSFSLFNVPVKEGAELNGRVLLNQPVNLTREILLNHKENFISVEFAGLNYVNPAQTYFRYKLENFDQNWTEITTNGSGRVTYTGLRPGTYHLVVYTANNDKRWSEAPATLTLVIKPPFWVTGYAFFIYGVLFIALIAATVLLFERRNNRRIREQQELNFRKQREELDQMKFRFFTNISHEFRTPLTLILTPLDALIKEVDNLKLKNKLISIHRNAKDLLTLVNQLLDFRKLEMKGEELELSKHNLVAFVENVYIQFKDTIAAKSIDFTIESSKDSFILCFDAQKIHKVLNNLLSNALKHTPDGGTIALKIDARQEQEQHYLLVSVSDTGSGIAKDDLDKIFDRFYQSRKDESNYAGSSGIGLHLVKEYLDMHRGKITVESQQGKGSTFTIYIPANLKPNTSTAPEALPEPINLVPEANIQPEGRTILVVEDNAEFRRFLSEQLSAEFRILEAEDGEAGEQVALAHSPDLIISDLMMPKVDGITLCKRLKTNIQTSHIPFILLTARSSDEAKMDGYEAGADSYISKPFNFDMLMVRIKKLIEQQEKRQKLFHQTIEVTPGSITVNSLDEEFIQKALFCVEKNIDNTDYSIEDLSSDVGMHRSHLYRKIQSITGQTPIDFMRSIRLKRAAQLLRDSQYRISEIADRVGFNTIKYFNKYFKDEFGMTPTQYRSQQKE